jgi:hypothetical protein
MLLALFHSDKRQVFRGRRGRKSPFGHSFGDSAPYAGLAAFRRRPPVHMLFRLNTTDPAVGVELPGANWLPLLCAIRYGACDLGYRVVSDQEVRILHQQEAKPWEEFPTADYPATLPPRPLALVEGSYDPANPRDVLLHAGVFGYDHLAPGQFAAVVRYVVDEGIYEASPYAWASPEEYLRQGISLPFEQGRPQAPCPDPACANHARPTSLRTFALFQEAEGESRKLWGPNGENLQVIYQVCPQCQAIRTTNQCT